MPLNPGIQKRRMKGSSESFSVLCMHHMYICNVENADFLLVHFASCIGSPQTTGHQPVNSCVTSQPILQCH